ncbi:non-ribosomal peptide synthetase/type I polyketide synthase [Kinneretia aquatilis]|uniref:non-ribosomal peptide synthetase/type I polyketide synthase n=1 Tax=Kinneretia aquatilis TaxID=2070761 RepID=UPI0014953617|nr:non-ribosomal peptide synthetase/type I polyketide synthase [Paucibacter aquatile]WIV98618.1 non-ribosomal peptide synthetase [Paucibacter aquatile]
MHSLPHAESNDASNDDSDPALSLAIIGMAGRFPQAETLDAFWQLLIEGREGIRRFSVEELRQAGVPEEEFSQPDYVPAGAVIEDVAGFDAAFFAMNPREAACTDPQQRLFLEVAWAALEHAGVDPQREPGRIGIFAGSSRNQYLVDHLLSQPEAQLPGALQLVMGNDKDYIAGRSAYKLGLTGPAVNVQSACSTSLVAVHLAAQSVLNGECELALAGAASLTRLGTQGYVYTEGGIAAPDGHCRPFDAAAQGTVPGCGVAAVVLKRLDRALADGDVVHAVIRGSAINNDGRDKSSFTAPSVAGQAAVIAEALAVAGLEPQDIDFIEAHGTATALGDPIEVTALQQVYGAAGVPAGAVVLGSLKSNFGHMDACSGVAGLIKTVLALQHAALPPTLHYQRPNPNIDFAASAFRVSASAEPWPARGRPRRAAVSSFGVGGTNAHVVLEQAPAAAHDAETEAGAQLLVLSARSRSALQAQQAALLAHWNAHPELDAGAVAATLWHGRQQLRWRAALACTDAADARKRLAQPLPVREAPAQRPALVFMFPGQGAQQLGMGRALAAQLPGFAAELQACNAVLQRLGWGRDLLALIWAEGADKARAEQLLAQTELTQPALFAIEWSLATVLRQLGLEPDAMIGHSLGEWVAAAQAGVFTRDQALEAVMWRGRLMAMQPTGRMLAVGLGEAAAEALLGPGLWLAAVNGPAQCSLSGEAAALEALAARLQAEGVACQWLATSHAYHSGLMQGALAPFGELLSHWQLQAPQRPFISNVSGDWIRAEDAQSVAYWQQQLLAPVRFHAGLQTVAPGAALLLELGPGRALSRMAGACWPDDASRLALPLQPKADASGSQGTTEGWRQWLDAWAQAWTFGLALPAALQPRARRKALLPSYPFEHQPHWVPPSRSAPAGGRRTELRDWCGLPSWQRLPAGPRVQPQAQPQARPRRWYLAREQAQGQPWLPRAAGWRSVQAPGPQSSAWSHWLEEWREQWRSAPGALVCAWGLAEPLTPWQEFLSLQQLLRGLAADVQALDLAEPLPVQLLCRGSAAVLDGEALLPARAVWRGLVGTAATEWPQLALQLIDLGAEEPSEAQAERLGLASTAAAALEPWWQAWRGQSRWVAAEFSGSVEQLPSGFSLPSGSHVLISGGLGGMGLTFARALAGSVADLRLTLLGRSPLEQGPAAVVAQRREALRELQGLGAQLRYLALDVADAAALQALAQDCARPGAFGGPVNAILHAAGVAGGALLDQLDEAALDAVFAPKVQGSLNLLQAFDGPELAVMLMCSSLSPWAPGLGQAHYAAANAFQAALAQAWRGVARLVAVDWCAWSEVGMAARISGSLAQAGGHNEIQPAQAARLLPLLLGSSEPLWMVSPQPLALVQQQTAVFNRELLQGKLPDAELQDLAADEGVSALSRRVSMLWQQLLGVAAPSQDADFFALGGHSLLATQLLAQLRRQLQLELPQNFVFEHPGFASMCAALEALQLAGAEAPAEVATEASPSAPSDEHPASFAQQRMWMLEQMAQGAPLYHMPSAWWLDGGVDEQALEQALQQLLARHEVLRSGLHWSEIGLVQRVLPPPARLLHAEAFEGEAEAALAQARQWIAEPFALQQGQMIKARLWRWADGRALFVICQHHIASDGWSTGILLRELQQAYRAALAGQSPAWPALPMQYRDYARAQRELLRGARLERQLAHWRERLADAPLLSSWPADRARPPLPSSTGGVLQFELSASLCQGLQGLAQAHQATLFMTLMCAHMLMLARLSGQDEVCVGTPVAGRQQEGWEPLVGFFVNTLVLRARFPAEQTLSQALSAVRQVALDAFAHQDVPFEQVVEQLQLPRDSSRTPLFQTLLTLQAGNTQALDLAGLSSRAEALHPGGSQFDVSLSLTPLQQGLGVSIEYRRDLFDAETVQRQAARFIHVLEQLVRDPQAPVGGGWWLLPGEREALLRQPPVELLAQAFDQRPLHEQLMDLATRHASLPALRDERQELSYSELAEALRRQATVLRRWGVGRGVVVGLHLNRGVATAVAQLAVLAAGGAFLPLDPAYPAARLAYMLGDARPLLVLSEHEAPPQDLTPLPGWRSLAALQTEAAATEPQPLPAVQGADLAYVIYTSGSTGQPKGVLLGHRGLSHLTHAQGRLFDIQPGQRVLQFASLNFDASVSELATTLAAGALLCIPSREALMPGAALQATLQDWGIEVATLPPVALNLLDAETLPELRLLITAGEACPAALAARWLPGRRLLNAYGPTELTVCATAQTLQAEQLEQGVVPIGQPIANARAYVLDEQGEPVPVGVTGELWLGGEGLAWGYLGRAGMTAERFVPDALSGQAGARLYRSGDLARWRRDGTLEFLGRSDDQLKLRGIRVELGEVQGALAALPGVQAAAVLVQRDAMQQPELVGVLVAPGQTAVQLRQALAQRLPEHLLPGRLLLLEALPQTANGKVDKAALERLLAERPREDAAAYEAPQTELQQQLALLWQQLLGCERVGLKDHFFLLGGHSLLATRLTVQLREQLGLTLSLRDLFETPLLADLAARCEALQQAAAELDDIEY